MKKKLLFFFGLLSMLCFNAVAQTTVSGTVTDDSKAPLPGVSVVVKGTSTGTVTNIDGEFKLTLPDGSDALLFSFIGYKTQEVAIGSKTVFNIEMESDTEVLEEVVVTAVGIEQNKQNIGYSLQNVSGDEIAQARETNLVSALSGKMAGVNVIQSSGSPGAASKIFIRGNSSITGNNNPLFVIDGIPMNNTAPSGTTGGVDQSNRAIDLNPNDIASMTVLKGAAATALYGVRASNGAIIITTKRGTTGKAQVEFSTGFTIDKVNKLPEKQELYAQGRPQGGALTHRGPDTGEGYSWGPLISDLEFDGSAYDYDKGGRLVAKGTGNGIPARAYDNYDNFFVNGITTQNDISVRGGSEKTKYFVSLGHLASTGIVPNSDFERLTGRINVDTDITDKLKAGMSMFFTNTGGNRIQRGSNVSGVALGLFRTTPTFDNANGYSSGNDAKDDQSSYKFADGTQRSYRAGIYDSPFWTVNENPFNDDVNRLIGNVNLLYSPLDWLKVSYKLGLDHFTERRIRGENINSANNPTGVVAQFSRFNSDLNSDFIVMAEKDINDDLYVTGLIGHNYYSRSMRFKNTVGTTLSIPGYFHISNATDVTSTEQFNEFALHGLYADVKLAYKDQLFLNATVRNDYVSFLPKGNNSYVYPALSLGWDFSQTLGLAEGDIFSYGKLRASWGQTGNTIFAYATQTYYNQAGAGGDGFINGNTFPAYGVNAFNRSTTIGNANLEPELTTSFEVGGEFKFLKGRIGLDLTYYSRVTEGQIIAVTVSAASGGTSTFDNTGDVENSGLEIVLDAEVLKLGDFKWDFQGNFTTYTNTVTSLADGVDRVFMGGFTSASSNAIAGEPFGVLYGSKFQRNTDGKLIVGSNGWPLRASTDGVVGDPNPDWIIGLRNTFTYKNFSLSTLLDIRIGGDMWNGTVGVMNFWGVGEETLDRTIKGFVYDGVLADGTPDSNGVQVGGTTNNIPVDFADPNLGVGANKWTRYAFGGLVEENIEDASWVRLRELTLNYNLPSSLFDNLPISSATISLTGRNLFLITEYSGIDPEANLAGATGNSFGLEYFGMPNTKSFGAKLNIKF